MNASVRLLESALPTSVNLHVAIPAAHPSAQILGTERMGSGTLVDPSGLIVTVNYVALGAESITVTLVDDTTASGELAAQIRLLMSLSIGGGALSLLNLALYFINLVR